jgi:hypothetical protein
MDDHLKQRLRDEVDAELGLRPPQDLPDVLTRGRSKRRALRLVTTMSIVLLGAALVGGFAASGSLSNDATPAPPAGETEKDPTMIDFPALTTTFVSPRNGFSIKLPERVEVTTADQVWGLSKRAEDGFDVAETGSGAVFMGASTNQGGIGLSFGCDGCSTDELVDHYLLDPGVDSNERRILPNSCGVPRSEQAEITIDRQPGRISECEDRIEATVLVGGRLYLFVLLHDGSDARAVFDAFVDTIDLTPETAIDFPGLTSTFVSPTYGYSFKYHDRGGLSPATKLWDPVNQQSDDKDDQVVDDRFDGVETGLGAYFGAASTQIPAEVSTDEWVDEYVSPGGCGVPRSQQAEITIDGQPGKVAECQDGVQEIQATVVAGGRLYLFILLADRSDARASFDAWIDTIELTPETAAVP